MNEQAPFQPEDLEELEAFLEQAHRVIPMGWVADGATSATSIGMRHDVDNAIEPAVEMAEWEAERGYRSTYFILHTAAYWQDEKKLRKALETIDDCGHEIGFHINAITAAIADPFRDPVQIAAQAVGELRELGYPCRGVVAHGDQACYKHGFVNDELFTESARPDYGAPDRAVGSIILRPVSRLGLGFFYDPNWLPRSDYLSDSGGRWSQPFDEVAHRFPGAGQLHMLIHPDWWAHAFKTAKVAA